MCLKSLFNIFFVFSYSQLKNVQVEETRLSVRINDAAKSFLPYKIDGIKTDDKNTVLSDLRIKFDKINSGKAANAMYNISTNSGEVLF